MAHLFAAMFLLIVVMPLPASGQGQIPPVRAPEPTQQPLPQSIPPSDRIAPHRPEMIPEMIHRPKNFRSQDASPGSKDNRKDEAAPLEATSIMSVQQPAQPAVQQVNLSFGVLIFFGVAMLMEVAVMFRKGMGWDPEATKIVGLTLIMGSGLFLITAGYSQEQIAPMIGLLGSVAGYLVGQAHKQSRENP